MEDVRLEPVLHHYQFRIPRIRLRAPVENDIPPAHGRDPECRVVVLVVLVALEHVAEAGNAWIMFRVYPDAAAESIDVRSGTAWVLSYSRMLSPANSGTIHRVESLACRCTQKSMSVRLPSCTSPSSPGSPRPLPFASLQNRKPDCAAFTSNAETSTLRASGRGVSCLSGDHRLS